MYVCMSVYVCVCVKVCICVCVSECVQCTIVDIMVVIVVCYDIENVRCSSMLAN